MALKGLMNGREKINRPVESVKIVASSRDGKIEIAVSDDGRGMDVAEIKSSAVRHAVVSQEAVDKLGEQEALLLVFHSGVTTSPIITDISGRGLGLAIVKEKVEKLNGTVTIDTRMDAGTTFRLVVPLTLATFRGTLVRVAGQLFVLPSTNVERVARVNTEAIQTVENRETLLFDGQPVSLVRLGDVLELHAAGDRQQTADASAAGGGAGFGGKTHGLYGGRGPLRTGSAGEAARPAAFPGQKHYGRNRPRQRQGGAYPQCPRPAEDRGEEGAVIHRRSCGRACEKAAPSWW